MCEVCMYVVFFKTLEREKGTEEKEKVLKQGVKGRRLN